MKSTKECYQALIDGKTLIHILLGREVKLTSEGNLPDAVNPTAFTEPKYWTIKPQPRVLYVNECKEELSPNHYSTKKEANYAGGGAYDRTVKFVEVIE